ncbi:MAG: outer membrane protein assembly factor BamB family protein [Planctomycetota bacterium]
MIKTAGVSFFLAALGLLAPGRATAGEEPETARLGGLLIPECDTPANGLLREADALRAKGEYQEAIAGYQNVLRNYATSLFPLSKETFRGRAGVTYVSVSDYVEEKMGSLPKEAREVYAKNYEAAAKALLEAGQEERDPAPLVRAARIFPIAPSGMEALGLLARWDLQSGRWPEAIARFRRVLRRDRFRWDRRIPEILSLGLALHRDRRSRDLDRLIREVGEKLDGERGKKAVSRLKALTSGASIDRTASFWHPRWGVNAEGTNVTSHAVGEAPKSWMATVPPPPRQYSSMANVFRTPYDDNVGAYLERTWRPFHPAVMDDRVFTHNGIEFICFDLLQGSEPLWRQKSFYAGSRQVGQANFEPNRLYSVTVSGDRIYMLMEIPALAEGLDSREYHGYVVIPPIPRRRLLALDARTGRLLWETGASERPFNFLDHLSFCTEPLAIDGRLYLAGAFFEGIPTAFVVALDARDGSLIWKRRVCAGSQELNMFGRPIREYCGSPITAVGNAIYFCTNLGAVASLRASDGVWRWVFRYAPDDKPMSRDFTTRKAAPAWVLGPVVATPERIVAAPTDCSELFGLDADSGTCRWSRGDRARKAGLGHPSSFRAHALVDGLRRPEPGGAGGRGRPGRQPGVHSHEHGSL